MPDERYTVGDEVEVNLAGLGPLTVSEVLLDPEAHNDWHLARVVAVLPDGRYALEILPLVGAIEAPPVAADRLRRRLST